MKALNNILNTVKKNLVKPGVRKVGLLTAGAVAVGTLMNGCMPFVILWDEACNPTYEVTTTTTKKPVKKRPTFYTADTGVNAPPESFVINGNAYPDKNGDGKISKDEVEEKYHFIIPKNGDNIKSGFFLKLNKNDKANINILDAYNNQSISILSYNGKCDRHLIGATLPKNFHDMRKVTEKYKFQASINGKRREDLDKTITYSFKAKNKK